MHVEPSADAQHRHSRCGKIIPLMAAPTMELMGLSRCGLQALQFVALQTKHIHWHAQHAQQQQGQTCWAWWGSKYRTWSCWQPTKYREEPGRPPTIPMLCGHVSTCCSCGTYLSFTCSQAAHTVLIRGGLFVWTSTCMEAGRSALAADANDSVHKCLGLTCWRVYGCEKFMLR